MVFKAAGPKNISMKRRLLALSGFLLLLALGITLAPKISKPPLAIKGLFSKTTPTQDDQDYQPLFYKELGRYQARPSTGALDQQYTVTIKVTHDQAEAIKTVRTLTDQGIDAYYTPMNAKGRVSYYIRSGVFSSDKAAADLVGKLQSASYAQARTEKLQ